MADILNDYANSGMQVFLGTFSRNSCVFDSFNTSLQICSEWLKTPTPSLGTQLRLFPKLVLSCSFIKKNLHPCHHTFPQVGNKHSQKSYFSLAPGCRVSKMYDSRPVDSCLLISFIVFTKVNILTKIADFLKFCFFLPHPLSPAVGQNIYR